VPRASLSSPSPTTPSAEPSPPAWASWRASRLLDVSLNKLKGSLPASLGALSSVDQAQFCDRNDFQGSLPEELGQLTQLLDLGLHYNPRMWGALPSSLTKLQKMTALGIQQVGLSGPFPTFWGFLPGPLLPEHPEHQPHGLPSALPGPHWDGAPVRRPKHQRAGCSAPGRVL